jgi:TRAP-type C4-dicarboxylate transport system substrate-binding protein
VKENNMSDTDTASTASAVVKDIMKVEPMVVGTIGMFVPGAAPIVALVQPWIVMAAPFLERALDDITHSKNGDALNALLELLGHISKGMPNSPILSEEVSNAAVGG